MQDNWQKRPRVPKDNAHPTDAPQWYSRGYVPHFDMPGLTQTMTFRLMDSMPQTVLELWREELRHFPEKNLTWSAANALTLILIRDTEVAI